MRMEKGRHIARQRWLGSGQKFRGNSCWKVYSTSHRNNGRCHQFENMVQNNAGSWASRKFFSLWHSRVGYNSCKRILKSCQINLFGARRQFGSSCSHAPPSYVPGTVNKLICFTRPWTTALVLLISFCLFVCLFFVFFSLMDHRVRNKLILFYLNRHI